MMKNETRTPYGLMRDIAVVFDDLDKRILKIGSEIESLLKAGMVDGPVSTYYRNGKYLYLIYPTKEDGTRFREYIGSDPKKIEATLAAIKRFERWQNLCQVRLELEQKKTRAIDVLKNLYWSLEAVQKEMIL